MSAVSMPTAANTAGINKFEPPAEMLETADTLKVNLEMPGLETWDIHVEDHQNTLLITGHRSPEQTEQTQAQHFSEFHYGEFERVITIPTAVQHQHIHAEYIHGVLKISLPKQDVMPRLE